MTIDRLFLSFAAVLHALTTAKVSIADLATAVICCTEREISDAGHIDDPLHNEALAALGAAKRQGRLVFQTGDDHKSRITFEEINLCLARLKAAPLSGYGQRSLNEIPLHCAVPTASDKSYEVFWAECPTPEKNWRSSWGATAGAA